MKAFLALKIRKSVSELTFTKLVLSKSDFLELVDFDFLDLVDFATIDRFSKLLSTQSLPAPLLSLANTS